MDALVRQVGQFVSDVPPDVWSCLITAFLSLSVVWTHSRGWKIPLLENLLDRVIRDPKQKEALGITPVEIVPGKSNDEVLDVLYAIATKDLPPDGAIKKLLDALMSRVK